MSNVHVKKLEPGISCTAIVKDGDYTKTKIGRAFASLTPGVSEFVLVLTGADDGTGFADDRDYFEGQQVIAPDWLTKACGDKPIRVFQCAWRWDFSYVRNFGIDRCKREWIFVIDADEVFEPEHVGILPELCNLKDNAEAYFFQEQMHKAKGRASTISTLRLFANKKAHRYRGFIHNQLTFEGIAGNVDAVLHHYGEDGGDHEARTHRNEMFRKKILEHIDEHPDDIECVFNLVKTYSYDMNVEGVLEWSERLISLIEPADEFKPEAGEETDRLSAFNRAYYMVGFAHLLNGDPAKAYRCGILGARYHISADSFFIAGQGAYMLGDFVNAYLYFRRYLSRLPQEKSGAEHVVLATETFEQYVREKMAILSAIRKYGAKPFEPFITLRELEVDLAPPNAIPIDRDTEARR
jgi:glycosyltransferase involved in cell wall biosynthesis